MGSPAYYHLPKLISDDAINSLLVSIGLPRAKLIISPKVAAAYHSIYMLQLPPNDKLHHTDLVLRVSGYHLPYIKTENEVGVMSWVSQNTTIPIPEIIAYDSSSNNPIAHEYTLLNRIEGATLSDVYPSLGDEQIDQILDQLIDVLAQLHAHSWHQIAGLNISGNGTHTVGQCLDETFWQSPDIAVLFPLGESVASINIAGPYPTYTAYITAQIRTYIHVIDVQEKLATMRDLIPRLEAFLAAIARSEFEEELNDVKLCLAHKDLHFGNILYDVPSGKITAVLDWEFSGVVPAPKWNPQKSFLWNAQEGEGSKVEKERLMGLFRERCEKRGVTVLKDVAYGSSLQESMQIVSDYLRAITEVVTWGERGDMVPVWREKVLENIAKFDV